MRKTYIFLLLVGGCIVSLESEVEECCDIIHGIFLGFLSLIYTFTLGVSIWSSIVNYFVNKITFNYYPILVTAIIWLSISFTQYTPNKLVLYAEHDASYNSLKSHALALYENGTFAIITKGIDWSSCYKGNYVIKQDSLYLSDGDIPIEKATESIFTNIYFINNERRALFPVIPNRHSSNWLNLHWRK